MCFNVEFYAFTSTCIPYLSYILRTVLWSYCKNSMFWCCICFYKKIFQRKNPQPKQKILCGYIWHMCCSLGWLSCIPDDYTVFVLWKKTCKKKKNLCEVQAMRCAILCKLLVIFFLLRFATKAASRTSSCYGDSERNEQSLAALLEACNHHL